MLALSIDRYRAVIFPLRPRLTTSKAAAVIGSTWMLAAVASLPVAITSRVVEQNGDERDFCDEVWPGGRDQRYAYSMAVMVLQYFLPLAILSFTYVNIGIIIWVKRAPGEAETTRDQRFAASKRKVLSDSFTQCLGYTRQSSLQPVKATVAPTVVATIASCKHTVTVTFSAILQSPCR